jgi:hypothetical protein
MTVPWAQSRGTSSLNLGRSSYSGAKLSWVSYAGGTVQSPAIGVGGTVYYGAEGYFFAMNATGTQLWNYSLLNYGLVVAAPVIGMNGTIYAATNFGYLFGFNLFGKLVFQFHSFNSFGVSPAVGDDGTIYIGELYSYFFLAITPIFSSVSGSILW